MGIYDREYYRKQGPSYLGTLGMQGSACKWLIGLNIIVYILQMVSLPRPGHGPGAWAVAGDGPVTDWLILDPQRVLSGEVWRLLTYSFLHSPHDWTHIVFNMLFLWWFGSDVEVIYGTREFLLIYLVSALLGGIAYTIWAVAEGTSASCLGASGAVTTVLVLCACHFPTRMVLVMMLLPVPIWLFVVFAVGRDFLAFLNHSHTGTAVTVHLAGAGFGFAYYKFHWRLSGFGVNLRSWRALKRRPGLRVVRVEDDVEEPVAVAAPSGGKVDEQLEAKLDAVLEKVARKGQSSLTESEREILLRASEVYKRRRS
jgi:membrane associated rhomboid family serine protease